MQTYGLKDIKKENITVADSVIGNRPGGEQVFYHQMVAAGPENGKFTIVFPPTVTTANNEVTGPSGDKSYHIFMQAYSEYDSAYQKVSTQVDQMLSAAKPGTTYMELLYEELAEKLGYSHHVIGERHDELVHDTGRELDEPLFRNMVTGFLISAELAKDTAGRELCEAMVALKRTYCSSLDNQPSVKRQIYEGIGLSSTIDGHSYMDVDDIVVWHGYCADHPTLARLVDYRKCPEIHIKLLAGKPLSTSKLSETAIHLSGDSKQVLFTRIIDYTAGGHEGTPLSTNEELDEITYKRNDWLKNGKVPFKLLQTIEVCQPCVQWSERTKRGVIQLKVVRTSVHKKMPRPITENMLAMKERRDEVVAVKAMKPVVVPCNNCHSDNIQMKHCTVCKSNAYPHCEGTDWCSACVGDALMNYDPLIAVGLLIASIALFYVLL